MTKVSCWGVQGTGWGAVGGGTQVGPEAGAKLEGPRGPAGGEDRGVQYHGFTPCADFPWTEGGRWPRRLTPRSRKEQCTTFQLVSDRSYVGLIDVNQFSTVNVRCKKRLPNGSVCRGTVACWRLRQP